MVVWAKNVGNIHRSGSLGLPPCTGLVVQGAGSSANPPPSPSGAGSLEAPKEIFRLKLLGAKGSRENF